MSRLVTRDRGPELRRATAPSHYFTPASRRQPWHRALHAPNARTANMDTQMMDVDGDIVLDVEPSMDVQDFAAQQPEAGEMDAGEVCDSRWLLARPPVY